MFSQADQWLNFDHPGKFPLFVDPMIQESWVKNVLVDGDSSINITFSRALQALGISTTPTSLRQTLHSSASCQLNGSTRWDISSCWSPSTP
jgi:hypothetical protein